jgi:hypothetical protein
MTTYEQLYKIVSPYLKSYRDDLEIHDKKILDGYTGPWVYGFRRTGTSLLELRRSLECYFPKWTYKPIFGTEEPVNEEQARKVLLDELVWVIPGADNKRFLHYDGKKIKEVSKEELSALWTRHVQTIPVRLLTPKYITT